MTLGRRSRAAAMALSAALFAGIALSGGCATQTNTRQRLDAGFTALGQKQYDQAVTQSDEVLKTSPQGEAAAEALYLRGRAFEERFKPNSAAKASDLQEARTAYRTALEAQPAGQMSPKLDGLLRAQLGNVAYFQDDYTTAATQLQTAYAKLEAPDDKAWALYRLGVAQQRLGRFAEADATFAAVEQQFPNTVQGQRAHGHIGARAFAVQFATFANPAQADAAARDLRRQGVAAFRLPDPTIAGRTYVRAPAVGYEQAKAVKVRFAGIYPDAEILP